jgi:hypothetical protein
MTRLDPAQSEIAALLFSLPDAAGYALAGGAALLASGAIDRPTRDLDAFIAATPTEPPGDVTMLASALISARRRTCFSRPGRCRPASRRGG